MLSRHGDLTSNKIQLGYSLFNWPFSIGSHRLASQSLGKEVVTRVSSGVQPCSTALVCPAGNADRSCNADPPCRKRWLSWSLRQSQRQARTVRRLTAISLRGPLRRSCRTESPLAPSASPIPREPCIAFISYRHGNMFWIRYLNGVC